LKDDSNPSIPCSKQDVSYHGDPIMEGTITLYHIYIGRSVSDYQNSNTAAILEDFATGLNSSEYGNILTYYYDTTAYAMNSFAFGGNCFIGIPREKLVDEDLYQAITTTCGFALDVNSLYTVFFRGDFEYASDNMKAMWLQVRLQKSTLYMI
jgi:hypothetical protein